MPHLLHDSIIASANKYPDHQAFRFGNQSLTYEALENKTNQLARSLKALSVKKGDRIGIYMNRCLETAIAVYGILKAGAVFVPLNPTAPPKRLADLLINCEMKAVVTTPPFGKKLSEIRNQGPIPSLKVVIGIHEEWEIPTLSWKEIYNSKSHFLPSKRILQDDLAYIMYTSGTTGQPKGIMHTHFSGWSYARLSSALYGLSHEDIFANHAALHFDISTFGYLSVPLMGATTVILSDAHINMPVSLSQLVEKEKISIWYSVPLALTQLLQNGLLEQRDLTSLKWVLYGGEPFPTKHLRDLMLKWPQAKFSNVYGPAEVNQCTYYHLPSPPDNNEPIPLGCTWDDTKMCILDIQDNDVNIGDIGELLICSVTMMRGYWKNMELTEKKLHKKVGPDGEEIYYRTGDLVKLDKDKNLHFMGRKDRQIKTRGHRVELDEVEAILVAYNNIMNAAVYAADSLGSKIIIASVIPKNGCNVSTAEIRQHLGQHLPIYSIPHEFIMTDMIPHTSAGKTDYILLEKEFYKLSAK